MYRRGSFDAKEWDLERFGEYLRAIKFCLGDLLVFWNDIFVRTEGVISLTLEWRGVWFGLFVVVGWGGEIEKFSLVLGNKRWFGEFLGLETLFTIDY